MRDSRVFDVKRVPGWLAAMLLAAPFHGWAEQAPNLLWIVCEDLDPALGCYGEKEAITPNLNRLAEEAVLFRNAFANAPICAPARSCLMTGFYPTALGSQHLRCEIELPEAVQPFTQHLREAGYFITNHSKTDYNFSPEGLFDYWNRDSAPWRKRPDPAKPFFSFINFGTTHEGPGNLRDRYEKATAGLSPEKRHDPSDATVPLYFPDTPKMRELWARYHDLASAMDEEVGEVIANLKADGLWENTIVWFFSDHGHGMPRHKRWLLDSGLRVPLLVRIPPKYQHLAGELMPGTETEWLVSFVDFAPTTLSLAGVDRPGAMQGRPFFGDTIAEPRQRIFGARDRADDMFELSRAVHDGRYLYVRHFLPHLPYIQGGRIMGDQKESMAELRRAREAGEVDEVSELIWASRKPVEVLYDVESDPHEVKNLAGDPAQADRLERMRGELREWILKHRDTGFLEEAEYHRRAREANTSIHAMAEDESLYAVPAILDAAWRASSTADEAALVEMLRHKDGGVRRWGATGFLARGIEPGEEAIAALKGVLGDESPSVAIEAAKVLSLHGAEAEGLPVLERFVSSEDLRVALQAARALFDLGEAAEPAIETVKRVRQELEGPEGQRRRYQDFNYASFTGWALEWVLINCGEAKPSDFE